MKSILISMLAVLFLGAVSASRRCSVACGDTYDSCVKLNLGKSASCASAYSGCKKTCEKNYNFAMAVQSMIDNNNSTANLATTSSWGTSTSSVTINGVTYETSGNGNMVITSNGSTVTISSSNSLLAMPSSITINGKTYNADGNVSIINGVVTTSNSESLIAQP